jgi:single-stranded DNA-binding protein
MSEEEYKLMSSFHFEGAKVVVLPPLGFKMVGERDMPYNTAVLEVTLPESRNNGPSTTLVEVEAWGKVAQGLSTTVVGDMVNVHGLIVGKPYVNKSGEQKYLTVLRLRGVEVSRRAAVRKAANDLGF